MRRIIYIMYSAMMFSEKNTPPKDWVSRTQLVFNYFFFLIFSMFFSNLSIYIFGTGKFNPIYVYLFYGLIFVITSLVFKKKIRNIIISNDPRNYYVINKKKELLNLSLMFFLGFLMFFLFIFSHKIQNYI